MLKLIRKKELTCKLCSTGLITLYDMRTESTLPWRRTGTSLRRIAGPEPTSRQAYKLDRLNVMGYYKNRGHPASHRLMMAVFAGAGPKKG